MKRLQPYLPALAIFYLALSVFETIGFWPRFEGRATQDRWVSYDSYGCAQSIYAAHLLREL